jgi:hypothetical protein
MNIVEEYFWKARMAFQTNRLNESCLFICQAIEQLDQTHLTLEQLELIWTIIPSSSNIFNPDKSIVSLYFRNYYKSEMFD